MRTVYPTNMVAHLWANKSQLAARNPNNTVYFDGDTIFSYGYHFPIARHVTRKGHSAILFTTQGYSVTTEQHKRIIDRACCHITIFHVACVSNENPSNHFSDYMARYVALVGKYSRARSNKPWILGSLRRLVDEANRFAQFFGLRARLSLPDDLAGMIAECQSIEKKEKENKRRQKLRNDRKREKEARENEKQITAWVEGKQDTLPSVVAVLPIRLRIKNDELQTSRGASVPLAHAIKAFRTIKRLRDMGQAYERNGHTIHLGHFALDAVDTQGNVRAGCHNVTWDEIARVATLAGIN